MTEVQILLMANTALLVVNGMLAWKLSRALRDIRRAERWRGCVTTGIFNRSQSDDDREAWQRFFDAYGLPADHPVRKAAEWESKLGSSG